MSISRPSTTSLASNFSTKRVTFKEPPNKYKAILTTNNSELIHLLDILPLPEMSVVPSPQTLAYSPSSRSPKSPASPPKRIARIRQAVEKIFFLLKERWSFKDTLNRLMNEIDHSTVAYGIMPFGKDYQLIKKLAEEGTVDSILLVLHLAQNQRRPTLYTAALLYAYKARKKETVTQLLDFLNERMNAIEFNQLIPLVVKEKDYETLEKLLPHRLLLDSQNWQSLLIWAAAEQKKDAFMMLAYHPIVGQCLRNGSFVIKPQFFLIQVLPAIFCWDNSEARDRAEKLIDHLMENRFYCPERSEDWLGIALVQKTKEQDISAMRLIINHPKADAIATEAIEASLQEIAEKWETPDKAFEMIDFLLNAFIVPKERDLDENIVLFLATRLLPKGQKVLLKQLLSIQRREEDPVNIGTVVYSALKNAPGISEGDIQILKKMAMKNCFFLQAAIEKADRDLVSKIIEERTVKVSFDFFWKNLYRKASCEFQQLLSQHWILLLATPKPQISVSESYGLDERKIVFFSQRMIDAARKGNEQTLRMIKRLIGKNELPKERVETALQQAKNAEIASILKQFFHSNKKSLLCCPFF